MSAMPCPNLNSIVARNDDVAFSLLDGHLIALHVASGHYHSIDDVGTRIWALLESPRSVAGICDEMQVTFAVDREQCELDMQAFLQELADRDLLRIAGEA